MPGKVKVKVFGGRNLPVMDRSNDTTDAYVEVKLGNVVFKTDVCRKSLNPEWNSEWFRFEMDDLELQDEPLQIRLMDYDTYSANDSIGRVYIDLNPLLMNPSKTKEPSGRTLSGWIPVYDTMHGIRGEVNLTVKVELFTDLNKFRQSSCGVKFFFTQGIPQGHAAIQLLGFVEELIVNDDPEYQWIDKIRTPRASNEARQMLFSKLSGEVQRRVGLKVLDLGGNAVVGYRQSFDLEGESGIVVRAIGTAATLTKIHEPQISPLPLDLHHKECQSKERQLAAVSIPNPSSEPILGPKLCFLTEIPPGPGNSPSKHSSMPESMLRNLCVQENTSPVPRALVVPLSIGVLANAHSCGTSIPVAVPGSSPQIRHDDESMIPFITSPIKDKSDSEDDGDVPEKTVEREHAVLKGASAPKDDFSALVWKTSHGSLRKGLSLGVGSYNDLYSQVRKQGSTKKDKYSTTALLKRVNDSLPEKTSLFNQRKDKLRAGLLKFFSKKRNQREHTLETKEVDDLELEQDRSPGYSRAYREPKFKKQFFFFRTGKRQSRSSRRSIRRSLSDSLSFDRNSLESLPSIQSEDIAYKQQWTPVSLARCANSPRKKVFDPETVIPESSELSTSSHFLGKTDVLQGSVHNDDILQVIRDLGYSHKVEKPLQLYISSLDALLVYEPVKNANDFVDGIVTSQGCRSNEINKNLKLHSVCSTNSELSNHSNPRDISSNDSNPRDICSNDAFTVSEDVSTVSRSEVQREFFNTGVIKPPYATSTTQIMHASSNFRVASELTESLTNPHLISPINPPASCVVSTAEPPSTGHAKIQSTSTSCSVEDPCGTGAKERNYSEKENGCDLGHGQVEKANGTNNSINTSSASSMPGSVALSHILESQNNKISLISSNTTKVSVRNAPAVPGAGRRSSESDLSTPPKGLLSTSIQTVLTSAHGKDTNPHSRGPVKDHFDILEYPFITISSLPPRFLHRMGSVVSASSVKVLDRISNLETPESRDSWWTEIRMEVRSHARALSCNVILGYEERTTICDDICILTAIGTAAIVNSATGGEKKDAGDAPANGDAAPNTAKTHLAPVPETRPTKSVKDQKAPSAKPEVFSAVQQNGSKFVPPNVKAPPNDDQELNCSALHIPYGTSLLPFQVKLNRCLICNKGLVPDILIVTVELPPNIPICGKICLIQVQVCRGKKDSKGESGAKEVSDSLPFLEYELHRRLVNKLKVKGLNAIFCLEKQIIIGEKMLVAVATGTAVCLAQLPPPELPKIIAGNSKTDTQKVLQFQKVVQDAFDRNRKSFMVDSSPFAKYHNGLAFPPDVEDEQVEDIPIPPLNLINGNKDVFILEVDDNEDIEIISDIIDSSSMIDTDMNTMDNILEYDDVAVVSQQMFTQVWRCKLPIFNIRMLSGQFEKILRAISYKLRNVRPCVINKLRFHLELPEPDEIQLSVTGTAFGLTMKPKNLVNPSPKTTNSIKEKAGEEPGMIFNLECDGNSNGEDLPRSNSLCTPAPLPLISTNVSSPSSPVQPPIPATSPSIRTATTDNAGSSAVVEKNKTSNEGGFQNPIPAATEPINLNLNASGLTQTGTSNSSTSPRQSQHTPSPHATAHLTSPAVSLRMHGLLPPLSKTVFKSPCSNKGSFIIEMTTLSQIPGYTIDKYLGNLNFFFIRETTSIKEMGGPTGFLHNLIVEVMTVLRAHVAALGGNALVSYFLNELALLHNPHKNQGQCLINIGGDVVFVVPLNQEDQLDSPPPVFQV